MAMTVKQLKVALEKAKDDTEVIIDLEPDDGHMNLEKVEIRELNNEVYVNLVSDF